MKSIIYLILFLFATASLLAKDIYVKVASTGDGSKGNPYGTVDDALRSAFSGDVVHVAKGDYFGPGGSGLFVIGKPDITLVGGYNDDFSQRDPFVNITRFMRGASEDPKDCLESPRCKEIVERQKVPTTKASYNAKGIVVGEKDHSNFVLDGFVVDGYTRNTYKNNDDLSLAKGPLGTQCLQFNSKGVKIRNSVILNCAGPGVFMNALGTKLDSKDEKESGNDWGEISNNIILNTRLQNVDFRVGNRDANNAPDGGCAIIKNNTLAFNWEGSGEDYNLLQGRQTQLTVKDNVMVFAGFAVNNGFDESRFGRYVGNVFYGHTAGLYRYMDRPNSTLILDDPKELDGEKCKKKYSCSKQSKGNIAQDPKFKATDQFFLDKFFNQIASSGGGKVTMDMMNQWRQAHGMNLQGSKGTGKVNYAPIWDPGKDWKNILIFTDIEGKGVQRNGIGGSFQTYSSKATVAVEKEYKEVALDDIKRAKQMVQPISASGDKGFDIQVVLKVGDQQMSAYYLPEAANAKRDDGWECYYDGSKEIYLYVKRGTESFDLLKQAKKEGSEIIIKGTAFGLVKMPDRVGVKIDSIESNDED